MKNNKIGKWIKSVLGLILFILLFAVCFLKTQQILKLNMGHRGTDNVNGFYAEKENTIDVLFIGASTAFCTADPLVLYEEYGITSYDFCSSSQPFELSYLNMQEALKTQKPDVIALEVTCIYNELDTDKADNLNYGITDMPFSMTKVNGIFDMFREDKGMGLSYLIPMVQYKDRWQELTQEDFVSNTVNYYKGAYTPDKIADSPLDFSSYYEEEEFELPERNREIFDRMVKLCQENDIKLFLFKSPSVGWNIGQTKGVQKLADDYGLPFVEFYSLMDELGIDRQQDFRDNSHLNRFGSEKASKYLGAYLKERYELADHRGQEEGKSWDIALKLREHDRTNEALSRIAALPEYMSAIPYQGHTVCFSIVGDTSDIKDFVIGLANAFGLDEEGLLQGGSFAVQNGQCVSGLVSPGDAEWHADRDFDTFRMTAYSIIYNREVYQFADNGLTILVYDDDWKQLVDIAGFENYDLSHAIRKE